MLEENSKAVVAKIGKKKVGKEIMNVYLIEKTDYKFG